MNVKNVVAQDGIPPTEQVATRTIEPHDYPNSHYDPTSGTGTMNGNNTNIGFVRNEIELLLHEEPSTSKSQRLHRILDKLPAETRE